MYFLLRISSRGVFLLLINKIKLLAMRWRRYQTEKVIFMKIIVENYLKIILFTGRR